MSNELVKEIFNKTLVLSPHCDDETIGCGGLINHIIKLGSSVRVVVFANSDNDNYNAGRPVSNFERYSEFINAMSELGCTDYCNLSELSLKYLGTSDFSFDDGSLDQVSKKIYVTILDKLIDDYKPSAVLFPYMSHNQDHNLVNEVALSALRPVIKTNYIKLKAMYEYPPNQYYKGYFGDPNLYVELNADDIQAKSRALRCYKTQLMRDSRDMLDKSVIMDMSRTRGKVISKCNAEAFHTILESL